MTFHAETEPEGAFAKNLRASVELFGAVNLGECNGKSRAGTLLVLVSINGNALSVKLRDTVRIRPTHLNVRYILLSDLLGSMTGARVYDETLAGEVLQEKPSE